MREMSGRLEEIPGEEAFPAYLASRIAAFYESSGVVQLVWRQVGSLTICGTVSPAGGNFEEPVTQATLAVVGAFLRLSRARSDARRYPAIDPLISWSKYVDDVSAELEAKVQGWGKNVKRKRQKFSAMAMRSASGWKLSAKRGSPSRHDRLPEIRAL
jgi:V/A-type H+-transporting ATPase subunit A